MAKRIRSAVLFVVAPLAVASSAVGCGGASPEGAAPSNATEAPTNAPTEKGAAAPTAEVVNKPADLATLKAREVATGLSKQSVASADGAFSIEVQAASKPTVKADGDLLALTVPIGTRSPIACDVYKTRIDTAGSIARMLAGVRSSVKLTSAKVTQVSAIGGVPVIFVETDYVKEPKDPKEVKGGTLMGTFKIAVRAADTNTVLCSHNELGYSETFKRAVTEVATSVKPPKNDASFVQIDTLKLGDAFVGFRETRLRNDPKGGRYIDTFEARLLPKGVGELTGEDETAAAALDKTGAINAEKYQLLADGEPVIDLLLKRKSAKEYTFEGKQKGAPVKGAFKAQKEVTTQYSRAPLVKKFLAGKDAEAVFTSYVPRVNVGAALDETYKRDGEALVIEAGALGTVKVKVDAQGLPEKAEATLAAPAAPAGAAAAPSMVAERIEVRGAP